MRSFGIRLALSTMPEYPEPLRHIPHPPFGIYLRGATLLVPQCVPRGAAPTLAIVGTRRATHYGLSVADRLGYQLARCGLTVVSGMARGIDAAAL